MKRAVFPLALLAAASAARAQSSADAGFRVRLAYGASPSFRAGGDRESLRGTEIGVAIPLGRVFNQGLWLEPSYFGDGFFSDGDGSVYRITAFARHEFRRFGVRLGAGYAGTSRLNGSNGRSSYVVDLGIDVPFTFRLLKGVQPYLDVHNLFSDERALEGFFVGVGVKI